MRSSLDVFIINTLSEPLFVSVGDSGARFVGLVSNVSEPLLVKSLSFLLVSPPTIYKKNYLDMTH